MASSKQNTREQKIRERWYGDRPVSWWAAGLERVFKTLVGVRGGMYRSGLLKTKRVKVPVIVVGNITAGGGGKTPMVIWLVEHLRALGHKPGVISRGYGGQRKVEPMFVTPNANPAASGDEPLLIAKKTGAPVMVGKDRVKAANALINGHHVNVIVSDDGMQHKKLGRDVELVMLDAQWQMGNQRMIPAGPLREPASKLDEVDLVIYKGYVENQCHYTFAIDHIHKLNRKSEIRPLKEFRSQKVLAMAGIANPNSFFNMLSEAGLAIIKKQLPDHHDLQPTDFEDPTLTLITEKDAVKCEDMNLDHVWVVCLKVVVSAETERRLTDLIAEVMS